jgi:formate-dependent nitrite reductase cytochrome c552 subunit
MKHPLNVVLLATTLIVGLAAIAAIAGSLQHALAAPPLKLSAELLEEELPDATKKEELPVDNSACYVCHGNYEQESLVLTHGREDVSCVACHGESVDHRNDEDNITPPDTMYDLAAIDPKCKECHETHDAPAREVVRRWQERCPKKTDLKQIVCTDCHFDHRLPFRNVRWNKKTGELLPRKEETAY